MEQAARAEQSRLFPGFSRLVIVAAALFFVIFLLVNGPALRWAAEALLAAPLVAISAIVMFLLPGAGLLRLLRVEGLPAAEWMGLAIGASCALLPLLLLGSLLIGLRWSGGLAWAFMLLCGLIVAWPRQGEGLHERRQRLVASLDAELALLLFLLLVTLLTRLYATRDLVVGMWGDSYHHTVMARLIAEHGGIFSSWQPIAPLTTFTYHYGFHALVAWLGWLAGLPATAGLLVIGQILNALTVPAIHLLTRRLTGSASVALWAALFAVAVSPMPGYYVNWGRYTQLAGQTLLPAVCVAWVLLIDRLVRRDGTVEWVYPLGGAVGLAALLTSGLMLTHYRVAVFAACFVIAYSLYVLVTRVRSRRAYLSLVGGGMVTGGLAVLLALPWLLRLREGALLRIGQHFTSQNIGGEQTNALPESNFLLVNIAGQPMLLLATIGLLLLLVGRRWPVLTLALGGALVWLAANPYLVGLNGAGIITSFAVVIALYLLLAPFAGGIGLAGEWLGRFVGSHIAAGVQIIGGAGLLLATLGAQQRVVDPAYALFTAADARAVAWIRSETPPEATFFVNSFTAYQGTLYAGSDGGWWLPLLTGRQTNLPPLTYGSEAADPPDYGMQINKLNATIMASPVDTPAAVAALKNAGFDYLYDGPAANPPGEYIQPAALAGSSLYELVYERDGVTIWRVR